MQEISLPSTSISNISSNFLQDDFKFVVGGNPHYCSKILADYISPRISRIHKTDPCFNLLEIPIEDPQNDFKLFITLMHNGFINVEVGKLPFFLSICQSLGNEELFSFLFDQIFNDDETDETNVIERLSFINFLSDDSLTSADIINFASSHFSDLEDVFRHSLSYETIDLLLSSSSLRVASEDDLLNFIIEEIDSRGESFRPLLSHIDLVFLGPSGIETFINEINLGNVTNEIWENIIRRLMIDISMNVPRSSERFKMVGKSFLPTEGHFFEGIMNFLTEISGGLCTENGTVDVIDTSHKGELTSSQLFNYDNLYGNGSWSLCNELHGYFLVDFKEYSVNLTHYVMHAANSDDEELSPYTPKTWSVEGSNDCVNWTILDHRNNDFGLNSYNSACIFECSNKAPISYRYIKIKQQGRNHGGDFDFFITGVEFFGALIPKSQ